MAVNDGITTLPTITTISIPDSSQIALALLDSETPPEVYEWQHPQYHVINAQGLDNDFLAVLQRPEVTFGKTMSASLLLALQLERFADSRQTIFPETPLKDGSNLWLPDATDVKGSRALREMYEYHKSILVNLYRDHLIKINMNVQNDQFVQNTSYDRLDEFIRLLTVGPAQASQLEATRFRTQLAGPQTQVGFEWVPDWMQSARTGWISVQAAFRWAKQQNQDPVPPMFQAWNLIPAITRLIMGLLHREEKFEVSLGNEHVEDILMDKRINWLTPEDMAIAGASRVYGLLSMYDNQLKNLLAVYQSQMRKCFDYRLLRWGYKRHWEKIFLVLNSDQAMKDAVNMFKAWANNNSRLAYDIFGVHPMLKDDITEDENLCTICYSEFDAGELVMQLFCGHRFHPKCIYTHWDSDTIFSNPCVNCRESQGFLRNRIDFVAEKFDRCYSTDPRQLTFDKNLDIGITRCIEEKWPGGPVALDPRHVERWFRKAIEPLRQNRRAAKEAGMASWNTLD